ncbi:alpha/beta hydrolase [Fulvivirga maritima]|uniref:alpha/beta hydrolase n=1 Tax=Fulvivirga maritima TaxID=2904247 RepID=UPI001F1E548E|nr:alpha/beta hydrolase [Fulvivirga maritima]UII28565.1 alpha/beta hydrolase [Fulvivirga maritima]
MKIYAISGLGADERAFYKLQLKHPIIHLPWKTPVPGETLRSYAQRFLKDIDDSKPFGLMGLSFGGMVVVEIAKIKTPQKTIIISSVPTRKELPPDFRAIGSLGIVRIIPAKWLIPPKIICHWLFGVKTKEDKELLNAIIEDTDPDFFKWAIQEILMWNNTENIPLLALHGTKDRLIPCHREALRIRNGSHFMVVSHAESISTIINHYLA